MPSLFTNSILSVCVSNGKVSTEKSVVKAIEGLDKDLTILIIAHRLTTLKKCDLIINVKNKKITVHNKLP